MAVPGLPAPVEEFEVACPELRREAGYPAFEVGAVALANQQIGFAGAVDRDAAGTVGQGDRSFLVRLGGRGREECGGQCHQDHQDRRKSSCPRHVPESRALFNFWNPLLPDG
jgi:hypothetical protein